MTPERWIAPHWLQPGSMAGLRAALHASPTRSVVVDNFLLPDRAALLLDCFERCGAYRIGRALNGSDGKRIEAADWEAAPEADRFYRYREIIGPTPGNEMAPAFLGHLRFNTALRDEPMRAWFAEAAGLELTGTLNSYAKAYEPGDFLKKHSDVGKGRKLCLVLYMSREWRSEWGGAFEMYDPSGATVLTVDPMPNRLLLFIPRPKWDHAVAPIDYAATATRRYNYTSWFI